MTHSASSFNKVAYKQRCAWEKDPSSIPVQNIGDALWAIARTGQADVVAQVLQSCEDSPARKAAALAAAPTVIPQALEAAASCAWPDRLTNLLTYCQDHPAYKPAASKGLQYALTTCSLRGDGQTLAAGLALVLKDPEYRAACDPSGPIFYCLSSIAEDGRVAQNIDALALVCLRDQKCTQFFKAAIYGGLEDSLKNNRQEKACHLAALGERAPQFRQAKDYAKAIIDDAKDQGNTHFAAALEAAIQHPTPRALPLPPHRPD